MGFDYLKEIISGSLKVAMIGVGTLPFTDLFCVFFSFLESAQELIMISYINFDLPGNMQDMLDTLKEFQFSSLLNQTQIKQSNISDYEIEYNIPIPPLKFSQHQISSSFMINSEKILIFSILVPWVFITIVYLLSKQLKTKKNSRILEVFNFFKNWMCFNSLFLIFNNFVQELSLFVALEFRYASFNNWFNTLSFYLCVLILIYHFMMMFWLGKLIKSQIDRIYNHEHLESINFPQEFIGFFQLLKLDKPSGLLYALVRMIRKISFAFLVVFFYDFPQIQILSACILNSCMLLYLGVFHPFRDPFRNFLYQVNECTQMLIFLLLLLTKEIASQRNASLTIGLIVIFMFLGLILMNILIMLIPIILTLLKKCFNLNFFPLEEEMSFLKQIHWFIYRNPQAFAFKEFKKLKNGKIEMDAFAHKQILEETSVQTEKVNITNISNSLTVDSTKELRNELINNENPSAQQDKIEIPELKPENLEQKDKLIEIPESQECEAELEKPGIFVRINKNRKFDFEFVSVDQFMTHQEEKHLKEFCVELENFNKKKEKKIVIGDKNESFRDFVENEPMSPTTLRFEKEDWNIVEQEKKLKHKLPKDF